jgi:hypothetical protein
MLHSISPVCERTLIYQSIIFVSIAGCNVKLRTEAHMASNSMKNCIWTGSQPQIAGLVPLPERQARECLFAARQFLPHIQEMP